MYITEYMWVATNEFVVNRAGDIGDAETTLLLGNSRVKLNLIEQISQLFDELFVC
jgi:hypothetical protein